MMVYRKVKIQYHIDKFAKEQHQKCKCASYMVEKYKEELSIVSRAISRVFRQINPRIVKCTQQDLSHKNTDDFSRTFESNIQINNYKDTKHQHKQTNFKITKKVNETIIQEDNLLAQTPLKATLKCTVFKKPRKSNPKKTQSQKRMSLKYAIEKELDNNNKDDKLQHKQTGSKITKKVKEITVQEDNLLAQTSLKATSKSTVFKKRKSNPKKTQSQKRKSLKDADENEPDSDMSEMDEYLNDLKSLICDDDTQATTNENLCQLQSTATSQLTLASDAQSTVVGRGQSYLKSFYQKVYTCNAVNSKSKEVANNETNALEDRTVSEQPRRKVRKLHSLSFCDLIVSQAIN